MLPATTVSLILPALIRHTALTFILTARPDIIVLVAILRLKVLSLEILTGPRAALVPVGIGVAELTLARPVHMPPAG
jgi:ABC-type methionine transport system permease subunit